MIFILLALTFNSSVQTTLPLLTEQKGEPSLYGEIFSPDKQGIYPGIIIMHGAGGLTTLYDEYRKFSMKIAEKGYAVLLIDLYAETGKTKASSEKRFEHWKTWQKILINGVKHLAECPYVDGGSLGVIGFSRGAWITLTTISQLPQIKAFVNYYGVGKQSLENITLMPPTLMLYGSNDVYTDVAFIDSTYQRLKKKNQNVEVIVYAKADHGFNLYRDKQENEAAAADAFEKVCLFLEKYLKTPDVP
ncbi:MAG: dienelactone hydrolase family protein [Candidatus Aminicenantes bacterium]|nr:dienelactone hydrolase family protein [Candidatus Aminicenantes bacterium]